MCSKVKCELFFWSLSCMVVCSVLLDSFGILFNNSKPNPKCCLSWNSNRIFNAPFCLKPEAFQVFQVDCWSRQTHAPGRRLTGRDPIPAGPASQKPFSNSFWQVQIWAQICAGCPACKLNFFSIHIFIHISCIFESFFWICFASSILLRRDPIKGCG